ncbi:MAG: hypothetical protein AABW89_01240 [Nanoarchaeota archaeon]
MAESKEACLTHYKRANKKIIGLRDGLDKLFYAEGLRDIWTAFDGFLDHKGYSGNNRNKREKFAQAHQIMFNNWNKTDLFKNSIKILIKESPVVNVENNKVFYLNSEKDLNEILNFCYVPRGNLNHGAKDLERDDSIGQRNMNLVEHSFKVVHEILQIVLLNEGLI